MGIRRMLNVGFAAAMVSATLAGGIAAGASRAVAAPPPPPVIHEWASPVSAGDIALGPDGNMWFIASSHENGVTSPGLAKITPAGTITPYLDVWEGHCTGYPYYYYCEPEGLHFVGSDLYVSEDLEGTIWDFSVASGSPVRVAGPVESPGAHTPRQITDTGGYIYVTNYDGVAYFPANLSSGNYCFYQTWTYNTDGIAVGPDGNIWTADLKDIAKVAPCTSAQAEPTVYSAGLPAQPNIVDIVSAGGSLWFTDSRSGSPAVGRITTAGAITEYPLPSTSAVPRYMAVAGDGSVWFTEGAGQVGRFSPSDPSQITEYAMPNGTWVDHLATGPDGNMWYTGSSNSGNVVGEIAVAPNVAPTARFTATPGAATTPTSFNAAASTDPDGTITSYHWAFGDGTSTTGPAATTTHTYGAAGTYHVTLTVTDNKAATGSVTHDVTVPPPPPSGGYWVTNSNGDVYGFGSVQSVHALGLHLAAPIVAMAPTSTGNGYWLVGADGGVFAIGDARFNGSLGGLHLAAPITGIDVTSDGLGYRLVGSDGGVFALGSAAWLGRPPAGAAAVAIDQS